MITLGLASTSAEINRSREWLVTNGLGGYASGTLAGMNTRRYHGLLVVPSEVGQGRLVLLAKLEETLIVDGTRFSLSMSRFVGTPPTIERNVTLVAFRQDTDASFVYEGSDWRLTKVISMVEGKNATIVEYAFESRPGRRVQLEARPLLAFRDFHATTHENDSLNRTLTIRSGALSLRPYADLPAMNLGYSEADIRVDGVWYRRFEYEQEIARGLDAVEDLFNPLQLIFDLSAEPVARVVASTEPIGQIKRATDRVSFDSIVGSVATQKTPAAFDLVEVLKQSATQFLITRAGRKSLIAGFHWFGDWGRDTMISLPGLLLTTARVDEALDILLHYMRFLDRGMLPNRFPDIGDAPEYNTIDATLWFFEAVRRFVTHRADAEWNAKAVGLLRDHFYDPLTEVVRFHVEGTRFGIHVDEKGFLWGGDPTTQLTWMDAKAGDTAFTPRHGRAVEIQALWYNALRSLTSFSLMVGDHEGTARWSAHADAIATNFLDVFWNNERSCLYDVVRESEADGSIRPNQLFALSLHYPLVTGEKAQQVLHAVESSLLTPFGLRTLEPTDRQYRGCYTGDGFRRDSAYHQGTVWPWLIGPYFAAKLAVTQKSDTTYADIERWLQEFSGHLLDAGLGQVSEIFDGDPPFLPRGCIAQAWSVASLLELATISASHARAE